jgi:Ca2+-binding EF-hand superfamily protein
MLIAGAGLGAGASAQDYVGVGMNLNTFFSPSGQPFHAGPGQPYPATKWFEQADADKDGKISHDEFVKDATAFFNRLDTNHDGYINSPENSAYENKVAPEIQTIDPRIRQPKNYVAQSDGSGDTDPTAGRYQKQIVGASQYGMIDEPQPIRAADANLDFRVKTDEWVIASNQRFTILDSNGDGFITPDELLKTPAQVTVEAPAPEEKKGKGGKKKSFFGN